MTHLADHMTHLADHMTHLTDHMTHLTDHMTHLTDHMTQYMLSEFPHGMITAIGNSLAPITPPQLLLGIQFS